jgi:hypothetical protein
MRRRYPEYFTDDKPQPQPQQRRAATNVAPATRSTGPKRVVLTKTQAALAKKFGLTLEQYAAEQLRLEKQA